MSSYSANHPLNPTKKRRNAAHYVSWLPTASLLMNTHCAFVGHSDHCRGDHFFWCRNSETIWSLFLANILFFPEKGAVVFIIISYVPTYSGFSWRDPRTVGQAGLPRDSSSRSPGRASEWSRLYNSTLCPSHGRHVRSAGI